MFCLRAVAFSFVKFWSWRSRFIMVLLLRSEKNFFFSLLKHYLLFLKKDPSAIHNQPSFVMSSDIARNHQNTKNCESCCSIYKFFEKSHWYLWKKKIGSVSQVSGKKLKLQFFVSRQKKIGSNFSSEDSHERNNNRSVHPFVIQYIIFQFFEYKKKGLIRVRNILFLVL